MRGESDSASGHGGDEGHELTLDGDRRSFLKKAGIGVAAAWVAPTVLSTAAHAQGSGVFDAPTFRDGNSGSSTTTSLALGLPTGTDDGDVMLAVVTVDTTVTVTTPTDWDLLSGPNNTTGGTNSRSYLFAYTGALAGLAVPTFTRSATTGLFRGAVATYAPATGGAGVAVDASASPTANANTATPTFPAVTFTAANTGINRTVVYLGASSNRGSRIWAPTNPGSGVAVQSVAPDSDVTITHDLDVDASPSAATGNLPNSGGNSLAASSVTYTVALVTT
jgi:hypothetical protein